MKTRRHKLIREIIEQQNIETQYQLTEALARYGLQVTQATISRDIKDLGLVKIATGENTFCYGFPPGMTTVNTFDRVKRMLRDNLIRVEAAKDMLVLKSLPGTAQGVAFCIDGLGWKEIVGTIAGDDTIFVAIREDVSLQNLAERIRSLMA